MAGRIRSIKPEAFKDAELWDAEQETGLPLFRAYAALWCQADKEGRFVWKARELKIECLPYWDGDFSRVLDALASRGFIVRYTSGHGAYGWIPNFKKHQHINGKEADSRLPEPVTLVEVPKPSERVNDVTMTGESREADAPIHSPSLPDPIPIPDPEPAPVADVRGRFRMHTGWRPSEASIAAMLVALVQEWALPHYTGQFVGHFAESEEICTNPEWNQRWQKWVTRGWNDPKRRPSKPPEALPDPAELKRRREADEAAELAKTRSAAAAKVGSVTPEQAKAAVQSATGGLFQ